MCVCDNVLVDENHTSDTDARTHIRGSRLLGCKGFEGTDGEACFGGPVVGESSGGVDVAFEHEWKDLAWVGKIVEREVVGDRREGMAGRGGWNLIVILVERIGVCVRVCVGVRV